MFNKSHCNGIDYADNDFSERRAGLAKRDAVLPVREQSFRLDFLVPFLSRKKEQAK
jgi:hypothetical protein